ncbi:MAG: hypothetical protein SFY80_00105 [Verrucomicrobiota bacterium]|nr:hypothetical protein [Verrucomicrobiota bacterium]
MHSHLRIILLGLTWLLSAVAVFLWARPEPTLLESDATLQNPMQGTIEGTIPACDATQSSESSPLRPHPQANVSFDYPCMERRFDANWRETILKAMALEDKDHAYVIFSDLAESLGAEDIEAAVNWAWSQRVQNEHPFHHLLWRWGQLDAEKAMAFVSNNVTGEHEQEDCYAQVFYGAFIADPRKAIGLMQDRTSDEFAPNVSTLGFAFPMALKQNPHAVLEALSTLPEQTRKDFKEKVVGLLLEEQSYLQSLDLIANEDQEYRTQQTASILESWAENDPKSAMDWLKRSSAIENKSDLATIVASQWVGSDPASYFAQYSSISEAFAALNQHNVEFEPYFSDTPYEYFIDGFEDWTESAPTQARSWLDNTPDSPSKEALQAYISTNLFTNDPVADIQTINAIHDPTVRYSFEQSFLLTSMMYYGTISALIPNFPDLPFEDRTRLLQFEASGECWNNDALRQLRIKAQDTIESIISESSTQPQLPPRESRQP